MAGGAVGSGKDIAAQVVGVGPGLAAASGGKKLVQVVIGVGINRTVFRIGSDIAQLIVGIAEAGSVRKAGVAQAAYLGSGLGIVNVPVGIGLGIDIPGGDGRKAAQEIVAQADGLAQSVLVAAQGSVAGIVGVGLLVGSVAYGPGLLRNLVGSVVPQLGAHQHLAGRVFYAAGDEPPQGIVGIDIGIAGSAVVDGV